MIDPTDLTVKRSDRAFYVSNVKLFQEYIDWYAMIEVAKEEGLKEPQIPDFIVDSMMRIANKLSFKNNFIGYSFREDMVSDALYDCVRYAKKFDPKKMLYKIKISDVSGKLELKSIVKGQDSGYTGVLKYFNDKTNMLSFKMNESKDFFLGEKITSSTGIATVSEILSHTADNPFTFITTMAFNAFLRRIDSEKKQLYIKSQLVSEIPLNEFIESTDNEDDAVFVNDYIEFLRESGFDESKVPMSLKRTKKTIEVIGPLDEFEE